MSSELTVTNLNELAEMERLANEGSYRFLPPGAKILKCNGTTGEWTIPSVDANKDLAGLQLLYLGAGYHGHTIFENGKPTCHGKFIVPVTQPYASREELGHHDQTLWPVGLDGRTPTDPEVLGVYLPLVFPKSGRLLIYIARSVSGIRAAKNLIGAFASNARRRGVHEFPLVTLSSEPFKSTYGSRLHAPVFEINEWVTELPGQKVLPKMAEPEAASPDPEVHEEEALKPAPRARPVRSDFDDEVPF
jgi:hypothetical protein